MIFLYLSLSDRFVSSAIKVFGKELQYQNRTRPREGIYLKFDSRTGGFCVEPVVFKSQPTPLVRLRRVLWPFQLNLQSLHPNLEPVHSLDCRLGTCRVVEADKSEALALVGRPVDEHLRADDVAKGEEHLHELGVAELLGQVVDEEVAALGAADRAACKRFSYQL